MTGQQLSGQYDPQKNTGEAPSHELEATEEGARMSPWSLAIAKSQNAEMLMDPWNSPRTVAVGKNHGIQQFGAPPRP